jgi:hypothetical protein
MLVKEAMVTEALAFPFRRDNAAFVALGTALCSLPPLVAWILPALPYVGLIAWIVEGFVLCYTLIYFQSVLESSTRGDERLPMWPDQVDFQSLAADAFRVLLPLMISFLPLIVFTVAWVFAHGTWEMAAWARWTSIGMFAACFLYLPIALLIYSFYGEWAVLNVVAAARSIARIGRPYFAVAALLLVLLGAHAFISSRLLLLPGVLAVPIASFLFFYVMIASMRAVGRLYANHRERLGWE